MASEILLCADGDIFRVVRVGLDLAEDAQDVATEDFANVLGAVAARHEGCGNLGEVGGGVDASGRDRYAVKVRADADVVDARDLDDVVEVVDERVERRAADHGGV